MSSKRPTSVRVFVPVPGDLTPIGVRIGMTVTSPVQPLQGQEFKGKSWTRTAWSLDPA